MLLSDSAQHTRSTSLASLVYITAQLMLRWRRRDLPNTHRDAGISAHSKATRVRHEQSNRFRGPKSQQALLLLDSGSLVRCKINFHGHVNASNSMCQAGQIIPFRQPEILYTTLWRVLRKHSLFIRFPQDLGIP